MNKKELIDSLAAGADVSKSDAGRVLDAFVSTVTKSLTKKEPVVIVGFGSFDVQKRKARVGRNPQTGEAIKIKAQVTAKFRPGKSLKDTINKR